MVKFRKLSACLLTFAMVVPTILPVRPAQAASGVKVKSITFAKPAVQTLALKKGETYRPKVNVIPKKGKNSIKFSSSKKAVVQVTGKGVLKARKAGTATVSAVSTSKPKKKAKIKVTVYKKFQKVKKVSFDKSSAALKVGESLALKTVISPGKATVKKVVYRSSNKKIATVSKKGKVTAIKEGTAKITAYAEDGRGAKAVCQVTVKKSGNHSLPTPDTPAKVNCLQFRGVNNFMSYTVVRYLLPNGVKVSDLTGIQFDAETKKDTSIRFYAGETRDEKTELTSAKQEVKDTVTGTATAVVDNTTVPKTTHKLEIATTETTRPLLKSGAKQTISFALDAAAKERLQGEKENEVAFVVYPHAAKPQMTFYNLKLRTTMATYDVPLHTDNWMAGYGGILTFV